MRTRTFRQAWPPVKSHGTPPLVPVLLVALVLRLALFTLAWPAEERFLYKPDSYEYDRLAQNLLAGHGFTQAAAPPFTPELNRTPLYPALLALVSLVTAHNMAAAVLVNIAIGVATIALTYWLAHTLFGSTLARVAALLLATDLTTITYNNLLLTEVTFTALIVLGALALGSYLQRPRPEAALAGGLSLGLATLCRPIALYLAPALLPLFVWHGLAVGGLRAARDYLALNAGCFLLVGVWLLRNWATFGSGDVSSVAANNLYFQRASSVQAMLENMDVETLRQRWQNEFAVLSAGWTEQQKITWLNARALEIIRQHPALYLLTYAAGVLHMLAPERNSLADLLGWGHDAAATSLLLPLGWLQMLPVYALCLVGMVRLAREPGQRSIVILFALLIAYFVATAGPETYSRFRVPLMPFLSILGGVGLSATVPPGVPRAEARDG